MGTRLCMATSTCLKQSSNENVLVQLPQAYVWTLFRQRRPETFFTRTSVKHTSNDLLELLPQAHVENIF